ncbi:uncharacterized protein THITE_2107016 [Thermothielavioides terrestris NRRL 8126]|uniref:magnesium chelatase n=1 Tax=Thermothielavioides terrestris (strain ATCC 38088 / NRRL 8126) TaxID=578455 RepID=G2QSE7_THETT|nr:uncharacterized protein THITE_2107016 [Thermothielavioides terrestris NRRL 8126]AEO62628.1 hypothetical protein THITE_2107016 [Thermothielavioides terrestris NRRL 8126]
MADEQLLDKVHSLSDLGLAVLLCLVAREHCLISTEPDSVDELAEELRLIASKTFNLNSAIISCHAHTTLDEFATGLLVPPVRAPPSPSNTRSVSPYHPRREQSHSSMGGGGPASASGSYFPINPSPRTGVPVSPGTPSIGASGSSSQTSQPRIANVILAKDLNRAPRAVQIQALELLRTRRIFTRTSVQTAPKQFLFIALVGAPSSGQARVTPHLNDFLYLSHWHDPDEDGFPYLDEELGRQNPDDELDDDGASTTSSTSVVKVKRHSSLGTGLGLTTAEPSWPTRNNSNNNNNNANSNTVNNSTSSSSTSTNMPTPSQPHHPTPPAPAPAFPSLTEADISHLSQLSQTAYTSIDVLRYQANIITFLRLHRAVDAAGNGSGSGVTPTATRHLASLSRALAALHGLAYVTPALVALAARKVYPHRLRVVDSPARERSAQWGSEPVALAALLEGVGPEQVVEDVLGMVAVPG